MTSNFSSPKNAAVAGLGAVGAVVLTVLAFVVIFALGWAFSAALVALFLNVIGGFGLSFAQVVGLGGLLAVSTAGTASK
jgi:hypothetical protein